MTTHLKKRLDDAPAVAGVLTAPLISIVIPTYNEKDNIALLVPAIRDALKGLSWEIIVVDDDSPDKTYEEVLRVARDEPHLRCLRRVGRRGLSSAVIEGALAANADVIAVMDADFQHDERVLPAMYELMRREDADLVVGTRYAEGGGVTDWNRARQLMSTFATKLSRLLVGSQTTDPMSGFFMVRRNVFDESIYKLSQHGYKILLDIIGSSQRRLKIAEVPYKFRKRRAGDSKINAMILAEFVFLLIDKLSNGWIPARFMLFAGVGGIGLLVHLCGLYYFKHLGVDFIGAQTMAMVTAMVFNYFINNELTYRDRRLKGFDLLLGLLIFCVVCSVGALANVGVASLAIQQTHSWSLAGVAGALMGVVFNFGAASSLVWGRKRRRAAGPTRA